MPSSVVRPRTVSPIWFVLGIALALAIVVGAYLWHSAPAGTAIVTPSAEATAYLPNLQLADVSMKAAENLMQQKVVYINGRITNNGSRSINRIDVYCIFVGLDGREIYREKVPVVQRSGAAIFTPHATQSFQLPFDAIPDTWNQAMPRLVIAQIIFGS